MQMGIKIEWTWIKRNSSTRKKRKNYHGRKTIINPGIRKSDRKEK